MKPKFTISVNLLITLSALIFFALITACSSGEAVKDEEFYSSDKKFIFKDGNDLYRVEFKGDKISKILKNGTAIPEENIKDYEALVNYELKSLLKESHVRKEKPKRIKVFINKNDCEKDTLLEKDESFDETKVFHFRFDDEIFNEMKSDIDSIMKELKDKDIEVHIDFDDLKNQLKHFKELFRDRQHLALPHFDKDKFREEMKKFREELKNLDSIDIDLRDMLKEIQKDRNIEIIELRKKSADSNKHDSFLNVLEKELLKDGLIESTESDFSFKMNDDEIIVNGKKIPKSLNEKYRELFAKYEKDGDVEILIENDQ